MYYQKVGKIYNNNNNNCKIYNQSFKTFLSFLAVLPDGFFNSRHSVEGPGSTFSFTALFLNITEKTVIANLTVRFPIIKS